MYVRIILPKYMHCLFCDSLCQLYQKLKPTRGKQTLSSSSSVESETQTASDQWSIKAPGLPSRTSSPGQLIAHCQLGWVLAVVGEGGGGGGAGEAGQHAHWGQMLGTQVIELNLKEQRRSEDSCVRQDHVGRTYNGEYNKYTH